jgi:hypothetical protein
MKSIAILIMVLISSTCLANQKAITDTGDEVILSEDGTWKYSSQSKGAAIGISTNNEIFEKPESANFLVKSTKTASAYWVDTEIWSFKKSTSNEDAEYEFQLKNEDLYGLVINEAIFVPIEALANIAIGNARASAPDAEIVKKEFRTVNGLKVLYMEFKGNIQGIEFSFLGYYYSNESGATQYMAYTGSNLVNKYKDEINDFLNGLTIQ